MSEIWPKKSVGDTFIIFLKVEGYFWDCLKNKGSIFGFYDNRGLIFVFSKNRGDVFGIILSLKAPVKLRWMAQLEKCWTYIVNMLI